MRRIRLTAVMALAIALSFVFAPSALASQGEESDESTTDEGAALSEEEIEHVIEEAEHIAHENGSTHADTECIPILIEGGTIDDCRDAPNPLLPETNEIIWGSVGFLVVLVFLAKFGLPAAKKMSEERTAKIQADVDAAEQAKADAEAVKASYEAKVADAKSEAARIIEEARQAADQLKADQQTRLGEELAAARAQAQADIDAAKGQAMAELRGEVANIAFGAAESVVGANLDRDAQIQLIEDYINRVSNG